MNDAPAGPAEGPRPARRWWWSCALVFALALAATLPTTGDIGLTWDEPAYRYSQLLSGQWWSRLARAGGLDELRALVEPDALLYYWPYGRHGINFHPPLAGQLNLATHALFGRWMKDIPSRRLASVLEYSLAITLAFGFLASRYGTFAGAVAAGALLCMPRVYGDGHIAGTDTPGLLLWPLTAVAFWKGLHEPGAGGWRVLVGVLLGLAFVEKMAAVLVLLPLLGWLAVARLPAALRRGAWADRVDGLVTIGLMLLPLGRALAEILRLARAFRPPQYTNLFTDRPPSTLPGLFLATPLAVWLARRALGRALRGHPVWGVERPALETVTAVLAFAPVVGWLGNPAWWRETFPRLAHYYLLNTARRGALPDIQILYAGHLYEYSLPWHNAWVLIAITVPATLLLAAAVGAAYALVGARRDPLRPYVLFHFATLPALRMLPMPAHDGVRLFLPAFFFLALLAGWGAAALAGGLAALIRGHARLCRIVVGTLVLAPAAWQLARVHPYELSYYNELIGGPRGAWASGFELSYWYDAFNDRTLAALNDPAHGLPRGAAVDFLNPQSNPPTFAELQSLGHLRPDIVLGTRRPDRFPYVWLLTSDAKAVPFTRILFAMRPWYASRPPQLDGLRVASVADPETVSRAWALDLLATGQRPPRRNDPPRAPAWVRRWAPPIARFWGEGVTRVPQRGLNQAFFDWARRDPAGLRAAARAVAHKGPLAGNPDALRLRAMLARFDRPGKPGGLLSQRLLAARPRALTEAVEIAITRPDALRTVLTREPYTDPERIGGELDRNLPGPGRDLTEPPGAP